MKNRFWFRLTGWLVALVMILTVIPVVTFAEKDGSDEGEDSEITSGGITFEMLQRPEEVEITSASFSYTDENGKAIEVAAMDPNKANKMRLSISGLNENNAIVKETVMTVALPENIKVTEEAMKSFSNETVNATLSEGKLLLSWKGEKQDSVEATIAVLPAIPAENDLSGSYALITKTNVMVGATAFSKDKRDRITSFKVSEKKGLFFPGSAERSVWTLKHVSGEYYTVYSQSSHQYLEIVLPNHATLKNRSEEDAQKILVRKTSDGYYTFTFNGVNLNNSGNNAANGFASYTSGTADNEKFRLINPSSIAYSDVLIFSVNGGTGDTDPNSIAAEPGTTVTLPDIVATKDGQDFIGWADVSNILSKASGTNHTYHEVYLPGSSYTMKAGATTLYAVYNSTDRNVQFGIRKDGVIVDEPNDNSVSDYIGHFTMNGILKEGHWVIDINTTKPVNGYYVENNVTANLTRMPSAEEIAAALKKEGNVDFDPETQYVHYYVLKYAGKWKIDGVIRNKESVEVSYNVNAPTGVDKTKITNMPGGYQVTSGTEILIGTDKNSQEVKTPSLKNHVFTGWNTEADGSGTAYTAGNYIRLKNNLNLFAQWADVERNPVITLESDWPQGKPAPSGTMITLTANLFGFDGLTEGEDYILQWQYTLDGENWTDESGANGITYTYELNATTAQRTWRVVAREVE